MFVERMCESTTSMNENARENMYASESDAENGDMDVLLDRLSPLLQDCEYMHVFDPFDRPPSPRTSAPRQVPAHVHASEPEADDPAADEVPCGLDHALRAVSRRYPTPEPVAFCAPAEAHAHADANGAGKAGDAAREHDTDADTPATELPIAHGLPAVRMSPPTPATHAPSPALTPPTTASSSPTARKRPRPLPPLLPRPHRATPDPCSERPAQTRAKRVCRVPPLVFHSTDLPRVPCASHVYPTAPPPDISASPTRNPPCAPHTHIHEAPYETPPATPASADTHIHTSHTWSSPASLTSPPFHIVPTEYVCEARAEPGTPITPDMSRGQALAIPTPLPVSVSATRVFSPVPDEIVSDDTEVCTGKGHNLYLYDDNTRPRRHSCGECELKFGYKQNAVRHYKIVHEGKKAILCPHCTQTYVDFRCLKRHINVRFRSRCSPCLLLCLVSDVLDSFFCCRERMLSMPRRIFQMYSSAIFVRSQPQKRLNGNNISSLRTERQELYITSI